MVNCQALKVDYQNGHGEGHTSSPQNVRDDQSPQGVLRVGKDFSDDPSGCSSDNCGYYW